MDDLTHHILEIPEKGITKYLPRELAYCDNDEFRDIASLLYSWQIGSISYPEFRVQAVYLLLNLKQGKRKINQIELEKAFSNIEQMSYVMDSFFFDDENGNKRIKLNVIDNPVPNIRPIFTSYKGPSARFTDTTFGQYEDACHYYQMFYITQNVKHLWQLFFTYYQGKRYRKHKTERLIDKFSKLVDFAKVFSFFLFFESFQTQITTSKLMWEGQAIDLSILFTSDGDGFKSDIPGLGTKSLAFDIANTQIMGNLEEVRRQPLWEVLLLLYNIRKGQKDEAAALKKAKSNG